VFGRLADHRTVAEDRTLGPPSRAMDSKATDPVDDLGMPPKLTINLMAELDEETDILPTSHNRPPPILKLAGEVDTATREISELLLEISSDQPPALKATASGLPLSPACLPLRRFQPKWQQHCMSQPWLGPF